MSSIWTPGGEHPVGEDAEGTPTSGGAASTPDEQAMQEQLAQLQEQLVKAPPEVVIANHCYGLFELAALHLGQQPPNLEAARLAVDAMAGVVEGLGDRLGEQHTHLTEGLAQIRMAFVQIRNAASGESPSAQSPIAEQ